MELSPEFNSDSVGYGIYNLFLSPLFKARGPTNMGKTIPEPGLILSDAFPAFTLEDLATFMASRALLVRLQTEVPSTDLAAEQNRQVLIAKLQESIPLREQALKDHFPDEMSKLGLEAEREDQLVHVVPFNESKSFKPQFGQMAPRTIHQFDPPPDWQLRHRIIYQELTQVSDSVAKIKEKIQRGDCSQEAKNRLLYLSWPGRLWTTTVSGTVRREVFAAASKEELERRGPIEVELSPGTLACFETEVPRRISAVEFGSSLSGEHAGDQPAACFDIMTSVDGQPRLIRPDAATGLRCPGCNGQLEPIWDDLECPDSECKYAKGIRKPQGAGNPGEKGKVGSPQLSDQLFTQQQLENGCGKGKLYLFQSGLVGVIQLAMNRAGLSPSQLAYQCRIRSGKSWPNESDITALLNLEKSGHLEIWQLIDVCESLKIDTRFLLPTRVGDPYYRRDLPESGITHFAPEDAAPLITTAGITCIPLRPGSPQRFTLDSGTIPHVSLILLQCAGSVRLRVLGGSHKLSLHAVAYLRGSAARQFSLQSNAPALLLSVVDSFGGRAGVHAAY